MPKNFDPDMSQILEANRELCPRILIDFSIVFEHMSKIVEGMSQILEATQHPKA